MRALNGPAVHSPCCTNYRTDLTPNPNIICNLMSLKTLSAVLKVHQDFASFVSVTSVLTWQRLMVWFFFYWKRGSQISLYINSNKKLKSNCDFLKLFILRITSNEKIKYISQIVENFTSCYFYEK